MTREDIFHINTEISQSLWCSNGDPEVVQLKGNDLFQVIFNYWAILLNAGVCWVAGDYLRKIQI